MKNYNLYKKQKVNREKRFRGEDMSVLSAIQLLFFYPHTRSYRNLGLL